MTQGLDRRITLLIEGAPTLNEYAEAVPGEVTEHSEWCSTEDSGFVEVDTRAGTRQLVHKAFVVRWRRSLITTPVTRISIRDEYDDVYNIELLDELFNPMIRRRFIQLTGVAELFRGTT